MRRLILVLCLALAVVVPARAQDFPSREVRIVCGFAPGGTCDLLSRMLAEHLTPIFGQRVIVENRTGASGMIGADSVAKSPPDGHVVSLATMAMHTILPEMPGVRMPFDVDRDLTPIANVANIYNVLVVRPNAEFRTVAELIAHARANPGRLTYASAGNGSSQHLAAELFKRMAGVDLLHVPYRGGAPAIVDIVAGRTDMMFGNLPEFLGQIRGGGLRPLAFGAPRVSPLFPDLPRIADTLPGFEIRNWFGIAGPGNLPPPIVARWNAALRQVAEDPVFQRRMTENAMEIIVGSTEEFLRTIAEDRRRWGEVIRAANIRAD
ncbi:Bug family tripartite tricarboxylate transporter substrate binding protein [Caldovatus sediminis]|uniref:Bug family tripartite tricarboxylate transporter substrate binding protein n=1 Tax=Caldovatus sediminis TaxID=2041189 RepID=UPI00166CC4DB|nr:tripartite tricarboxylate transporter substrate binding protein [Caldovatus sediminis]